MKRRGGPELASLGQTAILCHGGYHFHYRLSRSWNMAEIAFGLEGLFHGSRLANTA